MREHFMIVTKEQKYLFVHKVVPENTKKKTSQPAKSKLFVNTAKYLKDNQHDSHYLFQKYACIFVLGQFICSWKLAVSTSLALTKLFAPWNRQYLQ